MNSNITGFIPRALRFANGGFKNLGSAVFYGDISQMLQRHTLNQTEKTLPWHFLFDLIPMARVFVLWKGVKTDES